MADEGREGMGWCCLAVQPIAYSRLGSQKKDGGASTPFFSTTLAAQNDNCQCEVAVLILWKM